ncbi:MAG: type I 3-dehydroquinate dehydratase [Phycisphaerales bacterium]
MTHLCVALAVDGAGELEQAIAAAARAAEQGATMVEWRVDALAEEPGAAAAIRTLVERSPLPCIVTIRGAREGGEYHGADTDRVSLLEALCTGDGPAPSFIDFELADYERSANLRQKVDLCVAHPAQQRPATTRLILSAHDFQGRPPTLARQVAAMAQAPACAVAKLAWRARSVRDCVEAFELLRERHRPTIALCMGEAGLATRVLAPKFGAFLTFARGDLPGEGTAPGQPTVRELVEEYGFGRIGPRTLVYGVVGWPVAHSQSPRTHNAWLRESGADAVYLPLPVPPEYEHFKATLLELLGYAPLDLRGLSVTLPHKEHLVRLVREQGGVVEPIAQRIGAANTLVVAADGSLRCTNTDAPAALQALAQGMGIEPAALAGKRVAVLGAGGVARAVAAGLADAGARVVVVARTHERAQRMAEELQAAGAGADGGAGAAGASTSPRGQIVAGRTDALACGCFHAFVNCTPVGMEGGPDPTGSPLPDDVALDDTVTVMDTVYAPRETPLLREARSRGARTVDGWSMFLAQARMQFDRWAAERAAAGAR